jgi:hypothetical protein
MGPPSPKSFGLNPDYVINHPKAMYPGLPLWHTNRLFSANTDALIYPQRRHTPPPSLMWHETSFIEEHWSVLADVVIRYRLKSTDHVRDARIRIKDNGEGFWMQVRGCRKTTSESNWKWKEIKHTELTPLTPCQQNKDYPWIIINGKQDVGRYCKALSCPKLADDAETTDVWFMVALARVEVRDGVRVTVVDEPMQERRVRQGDLGVVFRTFEERKKEPAVYEGVRATARKRKNAPGAEVEDEEVVDGEAEERQENLLDNAVQRPENVVDSEVEGPIAKKRKIGHVVADGDVEVSDKVEGNNMEVSCEASTNSEDGTDSSK